MLVRPGVRACQCLPSLSGLRDLAGLEGSALGRGIRCLFVDP